MTPKAAVRAYLTGAVAMGGIAVLGAAAHAALSFGFP